MNNCSEYCKMRVLYAYYDQVGYLKNKEEMAERHPSFFTCIKECELYFEKRQDKNDFKESRK